MVFFGLKVVILLSFLLIWEYSFLGFVKEYIIFIKFIVLKTIFRWVLEFRGWFVVIDFVFSIVNNVDNIVFGCFFWKLFRFWIWVWCKLYCKCVNFVLIVLKVFWDKYLCLLKMFLKNWEYFIKRFICVYLGVF